MLNEMDSADITAPPTRITGRCVRRLAGLAAFCACCAIMVAASPLSAHAVDLDGSPIFVRNGFDPAWTAEHPDLDDHEWFVVPGVKTGKRSMVLNDLPLKGMPRRTPFSLKEYPPREFTFITEFTLGKGLPRMNRFLGLFFANIGENWAVYLNGNLLRSEIHLDERGKITGYRHMRDVLIQLDPRALAPGKNILAVRIIGDPTNIDSGFHRSTPFVLDDYAALESKRSEFWALILIFLYLFFGVYHLFFFLRRPAEKYHLFYGLFSVTLFMYLITRTHAVYALVQDSNILHRTEYCTLYALLPLIGAFIELLLEGAASRLTKVFAVFYGLLILITAMPVSNSFAIDILRLWQITSMVPFLYYSVWKIGRGAVLYFGKIYPDYANLKLPERLPRAVMRSFVSSTAGNLLLGTLIMLGCALFDIADSMFWAYNFVLVQYGFFIFMIGITMILANRFVSTYNSLERANDVAQLEMNLATEVQLSLFETPPKDLENWDVALSYIPKYGASGDCYDFYYRDRRLQGISLFDVAGHGVAAALIGMLIKPITSRLFKGMGNVPLNEIYRHININISREIQRLDNIISCILLRFHYGSVEYVNAGHPDLLMRRAEDWTVESVGPRDRNYRGEPIGVNIANILPDVIRIHADKGDVLMLFTDGIMDSCNHVNEPFGMERIIASLKGAPDGSARDVLNYLLERFFVFINLEDIRDDFTIIVVKKK